ncbi:MAG: hypothetical protein ACFE9L_11620 [Candidatus Hodarchaeota archaeon]
MRKNGIKAKFKEVEGKEDDKGLIAVLGAITLAAFTSGAVTKSLEVLKTYFETRRRKIAFIFKRGDSEVIIEAENVEPATIERTIQEIHTLIDSGN